jgi:hypothetical protein
LPDVEQRLRVAVLTGGSGAEKSRLAEAFSRHIDGTTRLHALGSRLRGLRWRLRIKLDECCWWKPLPAGTPWDAGYLPLSANALAPLRAFRPRRATLIVADGLHELVLREALRTLSANQAAFRHAVRLLVIADQADAVAAMGREGAAAPACPGPQRPPPAVPVFDLQAA